MMSRKFWRRWLALFLSFAVLTIVPADAATKTYCNAKTPENLWVYRGYVKHYKNTAYQYFTLATVYASNGVFTVTGSPYVAQSFARGYYNSKCKWNTSGSPGSSTLKCTTVT